MAKVIIYPHVDPYYSGFYIYGLQQLFGERNIRYSTEGFEDIPKDDVWNVYLAFIVEDENGCKKYVIDSNDYCSVKQKMYEWCDVYGHCNANFKQYKEADYPKLVVLCPSFGIRCWSLLGTIYYGITNITKLHFHARPSVMRLAGRYYKQFKRPRYTDYAKEEKVRDHYIFSCNSLQYNTSNLDNDAGLNHTRTVFIDACRKIIGVDFEGGLVPRRRSRDQACKFADYLWDEINSKEYLKKIKESVLVFNTPAFWNCHGWKLGEYMALGKCIVTTPISNELPKGELAFYEVKPEEESMQRTIEYIVNHPQERCEREKIIKRYWEANGTPIASLKRLGLDLSY